MTGQPSRSLLAALSLVVLAGCSDSDIAGGATQVGGPALDFGLDPANARGTASGGSEITGYAVTSISTTLGPDAFNRDGDLNGYNAALNRYEFHTWVRGAATDPRLPALTPTPGTLGAPFIRFRVPRSLGGPGYNPFSRLTGLKPSTPYSIQLVRYGLEVRGALDAVEMLVFGTVSDPDSLVLLDPNPGGYPNGNFDWTSDVACRSIQPPAGANPFYWGPATSASNGQWTADKCFGSGDIWFRSTAGVVPDSSPVALNTIRPPVIAQQYNYIEVSEGAVAGGPVVARIQIGADIDPVTRQVIPNSFAPFPTAALSPGVLIATLKVAEGGPTGVRMTVVPLDSLAGTATYKILLVNREAGTSTQVNATYRRITTDTTGRDAEGNPIIVADTTDPVITNAIAGGAANVSHLIEVHDSLNTGVKVQQYTDLALQPPSATTGVPIWARYMRDNGTPGSSQDNTFFDADTVRMGTLPIAPNAVPLLFRPSGAASGTNRGDQVGISFTHLTRPPIGFFYAVWLIPTDTLQPPVLLGELTTPLPDETSLRDADIAPNGGVLTSTEILRATVLVRPAALRAMNLDLADYGTVRLTLEAKDGVPGMSSVVVLEGPFVTPP